MLMKQIGRDKNPKIEYNSQNIYSSSPGIKLNPNLTFKTDGAKRKI